MTTYDDLITALMAEVKQSVKNNTFQVLQGEWLAAEAEDSDLSQIDIEGIIVRWAPKSEHVTGLVAGDQVICLKGPGLPVTIIGVRVGDIRVADIGEV